MDLEDIAEIATGSMAFLFAIMAFLFAIMVVTLPWIVAIHFIIKYW